MSRSYKKAIFTDHNEGTKVSKRLASKAVRRCKEIDNGGAYKKVYCSWNICDWAFDERFEPEYHIVKNRRTRDFREEPTFIAKYPGSKKTKAGWIIPK